MQLPHRVARRKLIPELLEALVVMRTSAGGLQLVSTHEKLTQKILALMTQCIADVMPGRPFSIMIPNLSKKQKTLPKGMVVAQYSMNPMTTLNSMSDHVNAVQTCMDQESKEVKLKRH